MLKYIATKYPFFSVHLILDEINPGNIDKCEHDFIASAIYVDKNNDSFLKIKTIKHTLSKDVLFDEILLSSSKDALQSYSNEQKIIKKHEIIFYRYDEIVNKLYNNFFAPKSRLNENPKMIVDSYYMIYLLMKQNVGISGILSSMPKEDFKSLMHLTKEPLLTAKRFTFCKKNTMKIKNLSKIFFKILRNEGT